MFGRIWKKLPKWLRSYLRDTFTNERTERMNSEEWWDHAGW